MIISYDLSMSNTGWCKFTDDGAIIGFGSISTDAKDDHQIRLKKIGDALEQMKRECRPSLVVVERGFYRYNKSTETIFKVHGVFQYVYSDIKQIFYAPNTVKKWVEGRGNATKTEVSSHLTLFFGTFLGFHNNDESDACAVGLTYFLEHGILHKKEVIR